MADVAASVRAPRRARGPRHRICRPWVLSSTLLPKSLPSASMRCTCRRCGVTGPRRASLRPPLPQAGPGSNQVRGGSHPAPRIPLRCVPLVCHPALTSGLPEARLESRSWPPRSVVTATFDGPHPAEPVLASPQDGDTPVIVLTRACGRVAPVTRGSDALARVFPRRSPDPEDCAADAAFPRRPDGDTVGGPSAAPHRISRILSGTDVESISPFI